MLDITSYVLAELNRRKGERQLQKVADGTGINRRTIDYMIAGRPMRMQTLEKLYEYLKANRRKKVLDEPPPATTTDEADRSGHDSEVGAVLG